MPRTRGDGPVGNIGNFSRYSFAPHTRGWSHALDEYQQHDALCPAHAGMVPAHHLATPTGGSLPRTRGDGPALAWARQLCPLFAPHTRGWSRRVFCRGISTNLCPAHAGMVPYGFRRRPQFGTLPRTRGDGPIDGCFWQRHFYFAPHTRGWSQGGNTQGRQGWLCPAHAGMVRN